MKQRLFSRGFAAGAVVFAALGSAMAQSLTDLKGKGGSEIVYGPLSGEQNLKQGLSYILKQVHGHFGDRPQISGFFKSKSGEAVGAFFSVDDKNFTHANQSGLVLVSKSSDGTIEAAVMTDKAPQFKKSINGMLRTVEKAWGESGSSTGGGSLVGHAAPIQPLQTTTFPDGSGSIQLAEGWQIAAARMGGVLAVGPHGESMAASCALSAVSSNSGPGRQAIMALQRGRMLPGNSAIVPSGGDPGQTFAALLNQFCQKHRMPQGQANMGNVKPTEGPLGQGYIMSGSFSSQGESQEIVAVMNPGRADRFGSRMYIFSYVMAPKSMFMHESSTLFAMVNSLQQNNGRIMQESNEESSRIRAYGESVRAQTKAKQGAFDDYMASIDRMHDADDKQSKAFQNLQLGNSVVRDTSNAYHGTYDNNMAALLVEGDPEHYEYVPTNEFVKGVDY